jgi:hypothetical protein
MSWEKRPPISLSQRAVFGHRLSPLHQLHNGTLSGTKNGPFLCLSEVRSELVMSEVLFKLHPNARPNSSEVRFELFNLEVYFVCKLSYVKASLQG